MGIRTRVSTNPAMVLGGLKEGVTPLEMAYAYSTIANRGKRISGSFSASPLGPVAYTKVQRGSSVDRNKVKTRRVLSATVGEEMRQIMHGVVVSGTGVAANVTDFAAGKTGTTENYGDAWFVGFTDKYTVAVWVGYPDRLKYMKTEYHGGPVAGGTYPAQIWHDFMLGVLDTDKRRLERECAKEQAAKDQAAAKQAAKAQAAGTSTAPVPGPGKPVTAPPSKRCLEAGLTVDQATQTATTTATGTGTATGTATTPAAGSATPAGGGRTPPADTTARDGGTPVAPPAAPPAPAAPPGAAPPGPPTPPSESGGAPAPP
jgi:penicillin-binding protein 1A